MSYGHFTNHSIDEQREQAERVFTQSASDARNLQDEQDKQHPLFIQLQQEKASHALTLAKLNATLNPSK